MPAVLILEVLDMSDNTLHPITQLSHTTDSDNSNNDTSSTTIAKDSTPISQPLTTQPPIPTPADPAPAKQTQKSNNSLAMHWWVLIFVVISIVFYGAFLVAGIYIGSTYLTPKPTAEVQTTKTEINQIQTVEENSAVIQTVQATTDSVVSISVSRNFNSARGNSRDVRLGAGTGFIISSTGYIITNRHVVNQDNVDYSVVFNNGQMAPARVLDTDRYLDIAVLKVDVEQELKPLNLGDSDKLQPGQTVIAIGNSLGEFDNSISKGVVSGLGRTITASDPTGENVETLDDVIQTDASINPGNSGGPLLDIAGNVVGVNVARAQGGENVGFAIPINNVKLIVESVLENGRILRPYLGIRYVSITPEFARANNLSVTSGILISGNEEAEAIVNNSPADKAGLLDGDIITEIDGTQINDDNKLPTLLLKYKAGDKVKLNVLRGDQTRTIELTLENFPDQD